GAERGFRDRAARCRVASGDEAERPDLAAGRIRPVDARAVVGRRGEDSARNAAEPLIGSLKSCDQRSAPDAASSAKTVPPPLPATTVPDATTGVPVKSPSLDWKLQALVSAAALAGEGPSAPPSRVFARSLP